MLSNVFPYLRFCLLWAHGKFVEKKSKSLASKLLMNYLKVSTYSINELKHLKVTYRVCHITRRKTCIFDSSLRLNFSCKKHFAIKIPLVA